LFLTINSTFFIEGSCRIKAKYNIESGEISAERGRTERLVVLYIIAAATGVSCFPVHAWTGFILGVLGATAFIFLTIGEGNTTNIIDNQIAARIGQIGEYIVTNYNITFLKFNHDRNHVHILFSAYSNSALSKYINAFKSDSSQLAKREFPKIRKCLWKEYFWFRSFCLLTIGEAPIKVMF